MRTQEWTPAGAIIGFREWDVREGLLVGLTNGEVWPVEGARARCDRRDETRDHPPESSPLPDCSCGLYADHDPSDRGGAFRGAVLAWGRVQVHARGFRAEHARPIALVLPEARDHLPAAQGLARRYAVRLVPAEQLAAAASEFGSPIPLTARPVHPFNLLATATRDLRAYQRGYPRRRQSSFTDQEVLAESLMVVLEWARQQGWLSMQQESLLVAVGNAVVGVHVARLALGHDTPPSQIQDRALSLFTALSRDEDPAAMFELLNGEPTWGELEAWTAARLPGQCPRPSSVEGMPAPRQLLTEGELRRLLRETAQFGARANGLVDVLWQVARFIEIEDRPLALEMFQAGVRSHAPLAYLLRQKTVVHPARIEAGLPDQAEQQVARAILNDRSITSSYLVTRAVSLLPPEEVPIERVEAALRQGSGRGYFEHFRLLQDLGGPGVTLARRLLKGDSNDELLAACVAVLGDEARAEALDLLARKPRLVHQSRPLRELIGSEALTDAAHTQLEDATATILARLEAVELLPAPAQQRELNRLLSEVRGTPDERSAWIKLSSGGMFLPDPEPKLMADVLERHLLPARSVLSLIRRMPHLARRPARHLWESEPLSARDAAVVLDCLWPDAPALARAALAEVDNVGTTPDPSSRIAAALALLGPADDQARETADRLARNQGAPEHLRITALRVLGPAGRTLAQHLLESSEAELPRRFHEAAVQIVAHSGMKWRERHWMLDQTDLV